MKPARPTLADAVLLVTELFDIAYCAHLRRSIAVRQGRRSRRAEYDLALLLEEVIPDAFIEHQGVDGDLVWWLSTRALGRRRGAIEERVLLAHPGSRDVFERDWLWRVFHARLSTSPAGIAWGHFSARSPGSWS